MARVGRRPWRLYRRAKLSRLPSIAGRAGRAKSAGLVSLVAREVGPQLVGCALRRRTTMAFAVRPWILPCSMMPGERVGQLPAVRRGLVHERVAALRVAGQRPFLCCCVRAVIVAVRVRVVAPRWQDARCVAPRVRPPGRASKGGQDRFCREPMREQDVGCLRGYVRARDAHA